MSRYATDPAAGGPRCMRGDEFFVETREGEPDALVIYLEAGGILDKSDSRNRLADWDLVHVPYCDGSNSGLCSG